MQCPEESKQAAPIGSSLLTTILRTMENVYESFSSVGSSATLSLVQKWVNKALLIIKDSSSFRHPGPYLQFESLTRSIAVTLLSVQEHHRRLETIALRMGNSWNWENYEQDRRDLQAALEKLSDLLNRVQDVRQSYESSPMFMSAIEGDLKRCALIRFLLGDFELSAYGDMEMQVQERVEALGLMLGSLDMEQKTSTASPIFQADGGMAMFSNQLSSLMISPPRPTSPSHFFSDSLIDTPSRSPSRVLFPSSEDEYSWLPPIDDQKIASPIWTVPNEMLFSEGSMNSITCRGLPGRRRRRSESRSPIRERSLSPISIHEWDEGEQVEGREGECSADEAWM